VSWGDALLYCHWLLVHSGLAVMLPSEAEWEKAKQGIGGQLPGVDVDLTGTVWEWTRSRWDKIRIALISSTLMIPMMGEKPW
jgi:formylglycine-generating enzyme required for sulfatase activity